jgi:hypothetical protein
LVGGRGSFLLRAGGGAFELDVARFHGIASDLDCTRLLLRASLEALESPPAFLRNVMDPNAT